MRTVRKLYKAYSDDIGDLRTQRPLPNDEIDQIDPFLFLNHHGPQVYGPRNNGLPFGPHPHRGFETVTFIVQGSLAHRDTGGHESVIHAGGIQWMTAGRGLEHSELSPEEFLREGGPLEILQLWVNLPSRLKMAEPRYVGLQRDEIPTFERDGGRVRVQLISGEWEGERGPVPPLAGVTMTTIAMKPEGTVSLEVPATNNVFLYVARGEVSVSGLTAPEFHLVEMNDDGEAFAIVAAADSLLLFGHAVPFGEPVVSHGPFVMNTREEIYQAVVDYQLGKFR